MLRDVDAKLATLQIVQEGDFRAVIFPTNQLALQNVLRERLSMKVSDAHASFADENRDAKGHSQLIQRELRGPKRARVAR